LRLEDEAELRRGDQGVDEDGKRLPGVERAPAVARSRIVRGAKEEEPERGVHRVGGRR